MKYVLGLTIFMLVGCDPDNRITVNLPNKEFIQRDCTQTITPSGIFDPETERLLYHVEIACRGRYFPSGKRFGEVVFEDPTTFRISKIMTLDELAAWEAYLVSLGILEE